MAAPYIEAALSGSQEELYGKAKTDAEADALVYGLTILSARVYSKPPRSYTSLMWRLNRDVKLFIEENQGTNPDLIDWAKVLSVSEQELYLLEMMQDRTDASYWIGHAYVATTSRTIAIYHPPVRTGLSGRTQLMNISEPSINPDVLMTAVHCVWALRMNMWRDNAIQTLQIQKENNLNRLVVNKLLGRRSGLNIWQRIEADTKNPPDKRLYEVGSSACGSEARFMGYRQRLQENEENSVVIQ